jgi:hypothetical protein
MKANHPYKKYESLRVWETLSRGLDDLTSNGDIEQNTPKAYIVGYLSKLLVDGELLRDEIKSASTPGAKRARRSSSVPPNPSPAKDARRP